MRIQRGAFHDQIQANHNQATGHDAMTTVVESGDAGDSTSTEFISIQDIVF